MREGQSGRGQLLSRDRASDDIGGGQETIAPATVSGRLVARNCRTRSGSYRGFSFPSRKHQVEEDLPPHAFLYQLEPEGTTISQPQNPSGPDSQHQDEKQTHSHDLA